MDICNLPCGLWRIFPDMLGGIERIEIYVSFLAVYS